jgi:hypothetical protein
VATVTPAERDEPRSELRRGRSSLVKTMYRTAMSRSDLAVAFASHHQRDLRDT